MFRGPVIRRFDRAWCFGYKTEEIDEADNCNVEIGVLLVFPA
jgi:hypothetical protein